MGSEFASCLLHVPPEARFIRASFIRTTDDENPHPFPKPGLLGWRFTVVVLQSGPHTCSVVKRRTSSTKGQHTPGCFAGHFLGHTPPCSPHPPSEGPGISNASLRGNARRSRTASPMLHVPHHACTLHLHVEHPVVPGPCGPIPCSLLLVLRQPLHRSGRVEPLWGLRTTTASVQSHRSLAGRVSSGV